MKRCAVSVHSILIIVPVFLALILNAQMQSSTAGSGILLGFDVVRFGAVGDGAHDDWWAFQQAVNAAAAQPDGGEVIVPEAQPGKSWRISQAIRLYSGVTIRITHPRTRILCSGDFQGDDPTGAKGHSSWGLAGCVLLGAMSTAALNSLPTLAVIPGRKGDQTVTLSDSADQSQLAVGDLVTLENEEFYWISPKPGSSFRPTELQLQRIEGFLSPGIIKLRYPLDFSGLTVLRRMTNLARTLSWPNFIVGGGIDSGIPLFASFRSGIIGGVWETRRPTGALVPTGGALECKINPHEVIAGFGVGYGNLFSRCQMSADHEVIAVTPVELAFHSDRNDLRLGTVIAANLPKGIPTLRWFVAINESSRHNQVTVDRLVLADSAPDTDHPANRFGTDVVHIVNGHCNNISVGEIEGTAVEGAVAHIASPAFLGTRDTATSNTVKIGRSALAGQRRFVLIDGAGTAGNYVTIGDPSGPTNQSSKIAIESGANKIELPKAGTIGEPFVHGSNSSSCSTLSAMPQ